MARQKRYQGEFLSISGIVWRAEIWQEAAQAYATVGDLEFDADEPVIIEWARVDKENVICGSSATLNLNSPGNGTYQDLYTIEAGSVQLRLYRNNVLYWSGTLDTEFYEEPYSSGMNYTVQLTFSDFGILDRLKYDLTGMQTLSAIVSHAVDLSGVLNGGIDTSLVSTTFGDNAAIIAAGGLAIRSDNFTDEDGEISTMQEVIEGILQPLGIRMVQRSGMIYLYDLNGLYSNAASQAVVWTEGGGMFGVDKVANNIKITFSPYSGAELFDGELEYGGKYDVEHVNPGSTAPSVSSDYGEYYSYYPDYSDNSRVGGNWDYRLVDFTIFLHASGSGLAAIGSGCKYFHLLPVLGGESEATGVAYAFRTGGHGGIDTGWPVWKLHSSVPRPNNVMLMKTKRMYVPKLSSADAAGYRIRLLQEILIDARYNPFSGSGEGNDGGNDGLIKTCSAFVFIPAKVTLYDAAGTALYHYSNAADVTTAQIGNIGYSRGSWVAGAARAGDCYLEYYDPDDLEEDAGIRGWKGNRHAIGRPDGFNPLINVLDVPSRMEPKIYGSFKKMEDGEYMPYPPSGGYLEVEIQAGLYGYDYGDGCVFGSSQSTWDNDSLYSKLRWCLYKAPQLALVRNNLVFDDAEMEDVEYSGSINAAAREEMEIDTICGTASQVSPTARGVYHRASTGEHVSTLKRAGRTDHPEKLLIGTLYSQYAGRKLVLTGVAAIDGGLHRYTEYNQGDMRMMLMSDVQNLRMDTTEAEYCEIRPDEYDER